MYSRYKSLGNLYKWKKSTTYSEYIYIYSSYNKDIYTHGGDGSHKRFIKAF